MEKVLLVIDDEEEFCWVMRRALKKHFDVVHIATRSAEALKIFSAEPLTHVVCDLFLGEEEPLGHDLVSDWKHNKPSLRYVALFTGSSLHDPPVCQGIDGIFKKPAGLKALFQALKEAPLESA